MPDFIQFTDTGPGAQAIQPAMVTLPVVNAASLAHEAVKPRSWHVEDLIPGNTVTLLNGDGGTGKSLLALQLAVATCSDGYWAGRKPEQGRVIYLGAEDDIEELHRRLVDICADAAIDLESLHDLDIVPLAGRDALLAVPARKKPTSWNKPPCSRGWKNVFPTSSLPSWFWTHCPICSAARKTSGRKHGNLSASCGGFAWIMALPFCSWRIHRLPACLQVPA
ncbi:AAA family ATPase [Roseibium salinum]|nr:AAA family ATPase [Roseibium salinum]